MEEDTEVEMVGIREYAEGFPVMLVVLDGRPCISATNQGGCDGTLVDLKDLLVWLAKNAVRMWLMKRKAPDNQGKENEILVWTKD